MNCEPRKKAILVVEDEYAVRVLFCRIFEIHGYDVEGAANAQEALAILSGNGRKFDVILTDYHMPGMNGVELAEKAKTRYPGLPVVGISTVAAIPRDIIGLFDAFLQKPALVKTVLEAVEQAIGQ